MIREIVYSLDTVAGEILPANAQWGGIQYEDKATRVCFKLSDGEHLSGGYIYRIDFNSTGGGYFPGGNLELKNGQIYRDIPYAVTSLGGECEVSLCITAESGEEVHYGVPTAIYFTELSRSERGYEAVSENISEMEESIKAIGEAVKRAELSATEAASAAVAASAEAVTSAESIREELSLLLDGTLFIFCGGDATGSGIHYEFRVDSELSGESANPVENRVLTSRLNELEASIATVAREAAAEEYGRRIIVAEEEPEADGRAEGSIWIKPTGEAVENG